MNAFPLLLIATALAISSNANAWWGNNSGNSSGNTQTYGQANGNGNASADADITFDFHFDFKFKTRENSLANVFSNGFGYNNFKQYGQNGYHVNSMRTPYYSQVPPTMPATANDIRAAQAKQTNAWKQAISAQRTVAPKIAQKKQAEKVKRELVAKEMAKALADMGKQQANTGQ